MFPEDVIPESLVYHYIIEWQDPHHSVSAFGSSIGTLTRSSIGAAIFVEYFGKSHVAVLNNTRQKPYATHQSSDRPSVLLLLPI